MPPPTHKTMHTQLPKDHARKFLEHMAGKSWASDLFLDTNFDRFSEVAPPPPHRGRCMHAWALRFPLGIPMQDHPGA